MVKVFSELATNAEAERLTHPEWLALLLSREWSVGTDRKLAARLRLARLRHEAVHADVDYRSSRGLDRVQSMKLVAADRIAVHDNLVICGATGAGKSWLAYAGPQDTP